MNRYSAIAIFDKDLDRVVLIEKQKPAWQAGKANFPGGKVELSDYRNSSLCSTCSIADSVISCDECVNNTHLTCAIRETAEETGLILDPSTVKHFATLRFTTDGQPGECRFFCCLGDVDAATTKEQERIFVDDVSAIMEHGNVHYRTNTTIPYTFHFLDTMPNLPWLCAMARQRLRDGYDGADVHVVEERGRVQPLAKSGGHEPDCRWAKALGSVAIECEHGVDVCPKCDPCDCGVGK